ncbi:hypothetical protein H6768_04780 [Candidatus Peribacteria bacterium]|nr:hypothetical protein [Candidatus Peribacteria bacterium]
MLGNSLTQQWLPERCFDVRNKLVAMQHYMQDIRVARVAKDDVKNILSPLSAKDISTIQQCEGFLDTPRIYTFLRDDAYTEEEEKYIESERKKTFKFK